MNKSQFQNLFDSVCRCFGHASNSPSYGEPSSKHLGRSGSANSLEQGQQQQQQYQKTIEESHSQVGKRRTNRLGLQDEQWDELFEKKNHNQPPQQQQPQRPPKANVSASHHHNSSSPSNDLKTAQALAQAKLAANPPRYNRTKRKRPEKARDEIFRSKDLPAEPRTSNSNSNSHNNGNNHHSNGNNITPFSRLLHPSLAMCFATPIRGTEEEADEARSVDNSDAGTLNTCEDTITSTVYFESKLAHLKETRPPMPLFNQFKVGQRDEIRTVMTKDSHSSVNMIRLLQQQQQQQQRVAAASTSVVAVAPEHGHRTTTTATTTSTSYPNKGNKGQLPVQHYRNGRGAMTTTTSSSQRQTHQETVDEEMEDVVPDVKAVSDSSGSDGSMKHQASRRKVYPA